MTSLALDVRELSLAEIDFVSGADRPVSGETVGAAVGGGVGAALGGLFGGNLGAAAGGAAGAILGAYIVNNWRDLAEMQAANRTPL